MIHHFDGLKFVYNEYFTLCGLSYTDDNLTEDGGKLGQEHEVDCPICKKILKETEEKIFEAEKSLKNDSDI